MRSYEQLDAALYEQLGAAHLCCLSSNHVRQAVWTAVNYNHFVALESFCNTTVSIYLSVVHK